MHLIIYGNVHIIAYPNIYDSLVLYERRMCLITMDEVGRRYRTNVFYTLNTTTGIRILLVITYLCGRIQVMSVVRNFSYLPFVCMRKIILTLGFLSTSSR